MWLLFALFFICRKTAAVESARLLWRAACPQDSSRGIGGGRPINKRSPFCTKGHCLPLYLEFPGIFSNYTGYSSFLLISES